MQHGQLALNVPVKAWEGPVFIKGTMQVPGIEEGLVVVPADRE
jgi:hypothetical protein